MPKGFIKPVVIRNRSQVEQYVIVDGRRHRIIAQETQVVDPEVARAFIETCSPQVVREEEGSQIVDEGWGGERVWLYNSTGNPDAPDSVKKIHFVKGQPVEFEIDNPLKKPFVVKNYAAGAHVQGTARGEETSVRNPGRWIDIHPWTRKSFPKHMADWFLNRDAGQSSEMRGATKRSRPPAAFEPNEQWELDDISLYLKTIDSNAKVAPPESVIRGWHSAKAWDKIEKHLGGTGYNRMTASSVIDEAIGLSLRRAFYRVADPAYRLPTQEEFDSLKGAIQDEISAIAEEEKVTKRGPGRPRKVAQN